MFSFKLMLILLCSTATPLFNCTTLPKMSFFSHSKFSFAHIELEYHIAHSCDNLLHIYLVIICFKLHKFLKKILYLFCGFLLYLLIGLFCVWKEVLGLNIKLIGNTSEYRPRGKYSGERQRGWTPMLHFHLWVNDYQRLAWTFRGILL